MLGSGLRGCDVASIDIANVDLDAGLVTVVDCGPLAALDVRWPASIVGDVEEAVGELRSLADDLEGVNLKGEEADRITSEADHDAFDKVSAFGETSCE